MSRAKTVLMLVLAAGLTVSGPTTAEQALPTVVAGYAEVVDEKAFDGVIEAVHQSTVSSQTTARIVGLPFDVDDFVDKGEVIVRFRDQSQQAQLEQARASLADARAQAERAGSEFERIEDLFGRQLVSKQDFDRARAELESAQARMESARAAVASADEQLEHTVVRAPYSGIVVERHVEVGETATVGQPLMTGLSLEHLRAVVDVPQAFIAPLRANREARVILPGGQSVEAAEVRIFPYADEATHTFRVRVTLPEGQHGVYPGMLVKVAFAAGHVERLLVPAGAVVRRSEVTGVYVMDPERGPVLRHVRAGRETADHRVEILSGLEPGEVIVTDPMAATVALKERGETDGAR